MNFPRIIQGGMGAGVSHWSLARTVSMAGQLGVVSGTALDVILARRLQDGDAGGHMREALAAFPDQGIAERILSTYFIEGGRGRGCPYRHTPMLNARPGRPARELIVAGNFVEVHLAKRGHPGVVGINYLGKIEMPTLCSLYGAMLAGVDYVLMGAGVPTQIPGVLDKLTEHGGVSLRIHVDGANAEDDHRLHFDPSALLGTGRAPLKRPRFLPIISSVVLANALLKKASGPVQGFIVEGPTAGGHNAPPRGSAELSPRGEPVYGPKDRVDLARMCQLGLPFWLAGGYGHPQRLREAIDAGAAGIQVGTAFALSGDSGLDDSLRSSIIHDVMNGGATVFTDPKASPTGFPLKVISVPDTNSERQVYDSRTRICDLGYLRTPYKLADGSIGYRCPAEPEDDFVSKNGRPEDIVGRKCLCNGLLANIGLAQTRDNRCLEQPLVTTGDDLTGVRNLVQTYGPSYSARNVIDYLLSETASSMA